MQKPAPAHSKIISEAGGWTAYGWAGSECGDKKNNSACVPWDYALDLVYSGNAKTAREYIDLAWKPNGTFKSESDFLVEFVNQIQSSPLYKLAPASFWRLEYLQ